MHLPCCNIPLFGTFQMFGPPNSNIPDLNSNWGRLPYSKEVQLGQLHLQQDTVTSKQPQMHKIIAEMICAYLHNDV